MKLTSASFWICIYLCAGFIPELQALSSDESELERADSLYKAGNFFEAGIAYERVYYFSVDAETRIKANLARARSLKQEGRFLAARNDLQRSAHLRSYPDYHLEVLYQIAFCDYMAGNYNAALSMLKQLRHYYPDRSETEDVMLLYSLASIMFEDWKMAKETTQHLIKVKSLDTALSDSLDKQILFRFSEEAFPVLKSEKKASTLAAVIPGSGHIYAGYPAKGLINISSQLLSLGLAGLMAWNQLYISGFVTGLGMFQSFYFGGIRQAVFLTHQRNLINMGSYKETLKDFVITIYEIQE